MNIKNIITIAAQNIFTAQNIIEMFAFYSLDLFFLKMYIFMKIDFHLKNKINNNNFQ